MIKNSVIFASPIKEVMSDYQIHLDDDLVTKAEKLIGTEESFKTWFQKKVEQWFLSWLKDAAKGNLSRGGLSDEELAEKLKDFPPLTMDAFPELSKSDFNDMVKSRAGRLPEGLEKWL